MLDLEIEIARDLADPSLNELIAACPAVMIYQDIAFIELLRSFLNAEVRIIIARSGHHTCGYLPALISKDCGEGRVLNSLPFYGSHGGIQFRKDTDRAALPAIGKAILQAFWKLGQTESCRSSTLIEPLNCTHPEIYHSEEVDYRDSRIGQLTTLPVSSEGASETILQNCHAKTRNLIRKALGQGFELIASPDDSLWKFLHQTHLADMEAKNGITKPRCFFDSIRKTWIHGEQYELYGARYKGEWAAALLLFNHRDTVEYYTPVINPEFRHLQPLSFLIHEAMTKAVKKGKRFWNWGGTWKTQDSVHHFKSRWGAEDLPYNYYIKLHDAALSSLTENQLLDAFPFFYTLPFKVLKG